MPISFDLTPEQEELRERIREFAQKELLPRADEIDEKEDVPQELVEKMLKELRLPAVWVPKKYGGLELDKVSICIITEEIGYACGSCIPFVEVAGLGTLPIVFGGKESLKEELLPKIARGDAFPSLAMTEPGCGSDAGAITLRAERDGDEYVLNGVKRQISQVHIASFFVTSARTHPDPSLKARGVSLFVVPKDADGVRIGEREPYIGTRGHKAYVIHFDNVRVPAEYMLGEENRGFRILMRTLDETRLTLAAGNVGIARAAFDVAVEYAKKREAFGKKLWEHEAIGFSLAEVATEIEAARLLCYKAAWLSDRGERHTKETSMAKWYATELAVKAALHAMTVLGGYGVMKGRVERCFRDAKCFTFAQGTTEIQKLIIAREIAR
ncbi:MAG: Acyl-CoA dehydrogenase related to the alkylation response protein AidB [Candidatus Alkanophagales archaeon MCA70_species_1]|nr:Acyl-CoA dehydrogenase related to the alkylation response protein AidB [Candidatus Alkanophaga volatiphilum]